MSESFAVSRLSNPNHNFSRRVERVAALARLPRHGQRAVSRQAGAQTGFIHSHNAHKCQGAGGLASWGPLGMGDTAA